MSNTAQDWHDALMELCPELLVLSTFNPKKLLTAFKEAVEHNATDGHERTLEEKYESGYQDGYENGLRDDEEACHGNMNGSN